MSTGLLNSLMNAQSQTATPAGQQMQVVMIPSRNIIPNPENFEIYTLGDMENLRDDIRQNGLRQPLEVIPVEGELDRYMLISGHRRWAACGILSACGDSRFNTLPCLIRESHGKLDDREAIQVGVDDHIGHVAVYENLAGQQAHDLIGRHAAV